MYLSNLTLLGFKSFVDRLGIDFQPGVTALVGPNGCGKSNIVDAFRWVLGEQSPKSLRGERMEDLIFAGNTNRKPLGLAEVSLTLSNIEGRLAVPHDELTITRRLYRSGESEYLINMVPCRLKDITGLFLDTALGREPYALIEQGAIGSLLGSKASDLRVLVEEAAGTMSYKVKRKTALSRLEGAQQNLLRVNDVLQELERQRNSLHRQAKKAERHQRMGLRLKEIQVLFLLAEDRRLEGELSGVIHDEKRLAEAMEVCRLRVSTEESSLETSRLHDLDLEKRITAAHEQLYALRSQRDREEAERRSREQMLQDLRQRAAEYQEERETVAERLRRLLQDFESDSRMRHVAEEELGRSLEQGRELADSLARVEEEVLQNEASLENKKGEMVSLTERVVSQQNHVASLTERQRLLRLERETLERQYATSQAERESVTDRERGLRSHLQDLERKIASVAGERAALSQEIASLELQQTELAEQRAALREELSGLESRLSSLQELEASLAGLNEGQQFLLKGKAEGVTVCQAIDGPLSRFVRVDASWEKAVEALLGDLQQGLLIASAEDALSVVRYLEQDGTGWTTLLPRQEEWLAPHQEGLSIHEALEHVVPSLDPAVAQRIVGPAMQLVEPTEDLQPLLHALLADAVIVQDLPTAFTLLRSFRRPVRVATTSGAVLSSRGPIQGGKTVAVSLLSRRRQLDELPSAIARATEELEAIEGECERVQEILSKQRQTHRTQEHALREAEEARRQGERSFAEVHTLASRLASQMEFVSSELTRVDEEVNALLGALQEAQTNLQTLSQEEGRIKSQIADCDRLVTLHRSKQQEFQREVAEVRIRSTSLQERREALSRSMERLEEDLARERKREAEISQEEEEGRSRQTQLIQEVATLQHSLEGLRQQEAGEAPAVQTLQQERDHLRENIIGHEEALKAARRELADIQEQQTSIVTRRSALITERSLLQKRLVEESEGGEPREDRADLPEDPQVLQEEAEELREKVAAMGLINMAALEEYQAVSERYRFLKDQAEDLTTSVTSLKATIAEINRTIEERFGQTLTSVNEHLNRFWQRLFEGGEAEIVLSQEEEAVEPGVEIRVRIPGKRTTTLLLLSGGEKSLGAIALLMALWAVRPSPFVVLDEVDAALDDPNVERFISLLRELARTSQIIIITHHPRTIEVADLLYGITMEERGISKLISVRLGDQVEQTAPASVP